MNSTEFQALAAQFCQIAADQYPDLNTNDKAGLASAIVSELTGVAPLDIIEKYINNDAGKNPVRRQVLRAPSNFKGLIGEITMDKNGEIVRIHDGRTAGGIPFARADHVHENVGGGVAKTPIPDYTNGVQLSINNVNITNWVAPSDGIIIVSPSNTTTSPGNRQIIIKINGTEFVGANWGTTGTDYNSLSPSSWIVGAGDIITTVDSNRVRVDFFPFR